MFFYNPKSIDIEYRENIAYLKWEHKPYTGKYKTYFFGTRKKENIWYFQDGKKQGEFITYHTNGKKHIISHYANWLLNGDYIMYYYNWNIFEIIHFQDWKKEWENKIFYESWKIKTVQSFFDDKIKWERIEYYENWGIRSKTQMKDNFIIWEEKIYSENWTLVQDFFYENWVMVHWQNYFEDTGKIFREYKFDPKINHMSIIEYDKDWKIISDNTPKTPILETTSTGIINETLTWSIR